MQGQELDTCHVGVAWYTVLRIEGTEKKRALPASCLLMPQRTRIHAAAFDAGGGLVAFYASCGYSGRERKSTHAAAYGCIGCTWLHNGCVAPWPAGSCLHHCGLR